MANKIKSVDFHCRANNTAHRTIEITAKQLIVRRGQSFALTLNMAPPFDDCDIFSLIVETGPFPSEKHGTRSEFGNPSPMYASGVKAIWRYRIDSGASAQRGVVALSVTPPADAPVGRYSLTAETNMKKTDLGSLVLLFNPWCSDDWVYLPDEKERQEYVMNEQGTIYLGGGDWPEPADWVFGQFEEDMVDICLKILDVNPKYIKDPADDVSARCNPIYVSRVLSAMINCNDDRGVLVGRWGDNYDGGERPTSWLGSVRILRKWYKSSCHPVKYGQCWVFAGVMCTVMRFFGIPCRVVTNFQSAHDTNNNLTIDKYFDEQGVRTKESRDSVWNFHVWVEGWMKRPDLQKGEQYDGWQVLDPTPQEKSEGHYCCGPSPVKAILQGDTDLKYDVPFVFAEVNADIVKWRVSADGSKRKLYSDRMTVGQNISTKAIGWNMRNDLTNSYKHRDGSAKEREVVKRAVSRLNSGDDAAGDEGNKLPKMTVKLEKTNKTKVQSGQDINLKLKLCNGDRTNKTLTIYINAQGMRYTGVPACHILTKRQDETVPSGRETVIPIQIPYQAYSSSMLNCDSMNVSVMAIDKQRLDDIYESDVDISMHSPALTIKALGEVHVFREITMEVKFTNTLPLPLTNCSLTVTGSGMYRFRVHGLNKVLQPFTTEVFHVNTVPYKLGQKVVVADFHCSAFRDVRGSCFIDVKP